MMMKDSKQQWELSMDPLEKDCHNFRKVRNQRCKIRKCVILSSDYDYINKSEIFEITIIKLINMEHKVSEINLDIQKQTSQQSKDQKMTSLSSKQNMNSMYKLDTYSTQMHLSKVINHIYMLQKLLFVLTLLFDIALAFVLIGLGIYYIKQPENLESRFIWINLGFIVLIRFLIVVMRILFEFLVRRIQRSTSYLVIALFSFVPSSHILPNPGDYYIPKVVLIVDCCMSGVLILYIFLAKRLSPKFHITVKMKSLFNYLFGAVCVSYVCFILGLALYNHIQRIRLLGVDHGIYFYIELGHFLIFITIFIIVKKRPTCLSY